jgi:hypothetical protein
VFGWLVGWLVDVVVFVVAVIGFVLPVCGGGGGRKSL